MPGHPAPPPSPYSAPESHVREGPDFHLREGLYTSPTARFELRDPPLPLSPGPRDRRHSAELRRRRGECRILSAILGLPYRITVTPRNYCANR